MKNLHGEKRVFLSPALQPANIAAVQRDYPNLGCVPLLPQIADYRSHVDIGFPKYLLPPRKGELRIIIEVLKAGETEETYVVFLPPMMSLPNR